MSVTKSKPSFARGGKGVVGKLLAKELAAGDLVGLADRIVEEWIRNGYIKVTAIVGERVRIARARCNAD
jgi:hypothetical protein